MRPIVRLCAALPFVVAGCAPNGETAVKDSAATATAPVGDAAAVRAMIERSNAKFADALIRGDTVGIADEYTDDAMSISSGGPPTRGRAAIERALVGMIKSAKVTNVKMTISEVDLSGDFAIETGVFEESAIPVGAKVATTANGNYVMVWKKQTDGSWKIFRDIVIPEAPAKK